MLCEGLHSSRVSIFPAFIQSLVLANFPFDKKLFFFGLIESTLLILLCGHE